MRKPKNKLFVVRSLEGYLRIRAEIFRNSKAPLFKIYALNFSN